MTGANYQPPNTVPNPLDQRLVRNISVSESAMRPLYTSCIEHQHAQEENRQDTTNTGSPPNNSNTRLGRPRFLTLNTLPRMPSTSPVFQRPDPMSSPFLRLPTEIRLQVYCLLVLPRKSTDLLPSYERVTSSTQDYYDYDRKQHSTDRPQNEHLKNPTLHIRSKYSVRADRFRARCMETTYHCVNNPRIEDNLAILRCNKQIHAEASELLYSSYTFDFDTHIEAIIPFFSDLTPFARNCIKSMRIVKRALPYLKEFDKCEWSNALRYLTSSNNNISLRKLELGVVAGRPGENGWDRVARYSASEFGLLRTMEGMEWLQYLLEVENLQELDVQAVVEHCPPTTSSSSMHDYVRFSASVETGFAQYLKGQLLRQGESGSSSGTVTPTGSCSRCETELAA